jgi:hypothetical protein
MIRYDSERFKSAFRSQVDERDTSEMIARGTRARPTLTV